MTDTPSSSEDLAVLIYLSNIKLISVEILHRYYVHCIRNVSEVCPLLNPNLCGQVYTNIVSHLYHHHKCKTILEYVTHFFVSPCMQIFQCIVVDHLQVLYTSGILQLSEDELSFIALVADSHCSQGQVGSLLSDILWNILLILLAIQYYGKYFKFRLMVLSLGTAFCQFLGLLLSIKEFYIKNSPTQNITITRLFVIVSKYLCQCIVMCMAILLMHIPRMITSRNITVIITNLTIFSIYSCIIYYSHTYKNVSVPCYICQFIPVCV